MMRKCLCIAHRGSSAHAPEHTRAAFELALEQGAQMIELDVQLSADNALVVLHDADVARTSNGKGKVRELSLDQLRNLDAGSWFAAAFAGQKVLTLEEVLELIGGRALLNVEIKSPREEGGILIPRLLASLERFGALHTTLISSFDWWLLGDVREESEEVRLALLWSDPLIPWPWDRAAKLRATHLHPLWALVTREQVSEAHARGLWVNAWTVNDIPTMVELIDMGVDGIITDYPDRLTQVLQG
ncbi:MAG: glycerophosphodiester phosphodiesterase family protein [Candidatus Binatia bacterium]|nr:glycerophosphodiester phosphodiesterase family protein [Candidatus Binatia bacterium]